MDYKEAIVQVGIGILAESLVGAKVEGLAGARAISGAKADACTGSGDKLRVGAGAEAGAGCLTTDHDDVYPSSVRVRREAGVIPC